MRKKMFRYFAGFIRPHENWLNKMSANGWRLADTSIMLYHFEPCEPAAYEYRVEFVAHKTYEEILDYKAFLEEMGYRVFHKNFNLNYNVYKVQWRPGVPGKAQIATSPGAYNKELLIVEKKRDGKPFALHTDREDQRRFLSMIRRICLYQSVFFIAMAVLLSFANIIAGAVLLALALGFFGWLVIRYTKKINQLTQEQITNE